MKILSIEQKKRRRNLPLTAAVVLAAVVVTIIVAVFVWRGVDRIGTPEQITIIVAWNPGSIADDIVKTMEFGETQIVLQNVPGANGADGLNDVYRSPHNGEYLLSTSHSAFESAWEMGFAESDKDEWVQMMVAFSPTVIVVKSDSPYNEVSELSDLIKADVSSGSNPAVNALLSGEADYAELLSVEVAARVNAGELRIIETLETGEQYGLFFVTDVSAKQSDTLKTLIESATSGAEFTMFLEEKGLKACLVSLSE